MKHLAIELRPRTGAGQAQVQLWILFELFIIANHWRFDMKRVISRLSLIAAMLLTGPVAAQDLIGEISAKIDGTDRVWYMTSKGKQSQSGISDMAKAGARGLYDVSLWGNASRSVLASPKGALVIDFDLLTPESKHPLAHDGPHVMGDSTLQYLENGYKSGWLALGPEAVQIKDVTFEKTNDAVVITGKFAATAAYSDNVAAQKTDPARTKVFTGVFKVRFPSR